jgi:hypothetical protein
MVCRHVVKALQACGSDQQLYTVINQQPNSLAPAHGIGPTPDYRAVYESLIAAVHACGGDRVVMNHIWKASRYALGRALTYQPGAWIGGVDRTNATDLPTRAGAARTTWKEVRCRTRLE